MNRRRLIRPTFSFAFFQVRGDEDTPVVPDDASGPDVLVRVQTAGRHAAERDHNRRGTRIDQDADSGRMLSGVVLFDSASHPLPDVGGLRLRYHGVPGLGAARPHSVIRAYRASLVQIHASDRR